MDSSRQRVAVVGAGFISEFHLDVLARLPVEVVAIVDSNRALAERRARRFQVGRWFEELDEMLELCRPDVAHVLVPPPAHAAVAEKLLSRGVSVLVEKPLATSSAECRSLLRAAEQHGATLAVNHNSLFHPSYLRLKEELRSGRLGRLQHVFACLHVPLRQLDARDYRHWMFQEPHHIVLEQGTHPFSQVHDLLGAARNAATLRSGRRQLGPGLEFFDTWQISLECERGPATVLLSFGKDFAESWLHAIGQDGAMRVDFLRGHAQRLCKTPWPDFYDQWKMAARNGLSLLLQGSRHAASYVLSTLRIRSRTDAFYVGMRDSIAAFHRAVRERAEPPSPGAHGLEVVRFCEHVAAGMIRSAPAQAAGPLRQPEPGEVLITGASGFLGGHLVERLRSDGVRLRLLVRRPDLLPARLREAASVVAGDLEDGDALHRAVQGATDVYHLATGGGATWSEVEESMVGGCRRIAEACLEHGARRLLFTSTIAALYLGDGRARPVVDTDPVDPKADRRALYARGKIACESLLLDLHRNRGLPVTIFRPGVVLGAGGPVQHSGLGLWARDVRCFGWGRGRNALPCVLVKDVADALARARVLPGLEGRTYNLVGDVRPTAVELVGELCRRSGRDFRFHSQPLWWFQAVEVFKWMVKVLSRRPGVEFPSYRDLRSRSLARPFDTTQVKRDLGWAPESDRESFLEHALGEFLEQTRSYHPGSEAGSSASPDAVTEERERDAVADRVR